jgi:hypothetical protein
MKEAPNKQELARFIIFYVVSLILLFLLGRFLT